MLRQHIIHACMHFFWDCSPKTLLSNALQRLTAKHAFQGYLPSLAGSGLQWRQVAPREAPLYQNRHIFRKFSFILVKRGFPNIEILWVSLLLRGGQLKFLLVSSLHRQALGLHWSLESGNWCRKVATATTHSQALASRYIRISLSKKHSNKYIAIML